MSAYENFKHVTPVDVRFSDLDALNHVNNAVYLTYVETARMTYAREVLGMGVGFAKISFILAKAVVDFKVPILLGNEIEVYTRCSRMGNKSFDLEYDLVKENNGTKILMAKAQTVMVGFDYELQQTIVLPDEWRKKISAFEGKDFE